MHAMELVDFIYIWGNQSKYWYFPCLSAACTGLSFFLYHHLLVSTQCWPEFEDSYTKRCYIKININKSESWLVVLGATMQKNALN